MKGCCGLDCTKCKCYQATIKDDDRMRMDVAIEWSKLFNETVLPREINCSGCLSKGVKFKNCDVCTIRKQHNKIKMIVNG